MDAQFEFTSAALIQMHLNFNGELVLQDMLRLIRISNVIANN